MRRCALTVVLLPLAAAGSGCSARDTHHDAEHRRIAHEQAAAAASAGFARLVALQGDWADATGQFAPPDVVLVTCRVTGGGSAVVETLFPGGPEEMVTVYHKDGHHLVLTHYCAAGNQPRMRCRRPGADELVFEFDGGTNIDPARDMHMHLARLGFSGPDEIRGEWQGWEGGQADPEHRVQFHMRRKG
ncbi:MAG: hypothetical protein FJ296_04040 [Planctomycetes bacterium]|nr:hypothetical protein [Planctomycetota bacterium]